MIILSIAEASFIFEGLIFFSLRRRHRTVVSDGMLKSWPILFNTRYISYICVYIQKNKNIKWNKSNKFFFFFSQTSLRCSELSFAKMTMMIFLDLLATSLNDDHHRAHTFNWSYHTLTLIWLILERAASFRKRLLSLGDFLLFLISIFFLFLNSCQNQEPKRSSLKMKWDAKLMKKSLFQWTLSFRANI